MPVAKVWKQLAQGLERYNAVLEERRRRITNVKALQVMSTSALYENVWFALPCSGVKSCLNWS